jgi:hypothetical protein
MKVNLQINAHNTVEMNFFAPVFKSEIIQSDKNAMTIRLLNNEISELLTKGTACIAEYRGNPERHIVIRKAFSENGWRYLTCRFVKRPEKDAEKEILTRSPL